MAEPRFTSYALGSESEGRVKQEFEALYKGNWIFPWKRK